MVILNEQKIKRLQTKFGQFVDYCEGWLLFEKAVVSHNEKIVLKPRELA